MALEIRERKLQSVGTPSPGNDMTLLLYGTSNILIIRRKDYGLLCLDSSLDRYDVSTLPLVKVRQPE